jgi:DNA mismatch repair ATPase MutS
MRVMSSMRISDNLGEDMSTFKAELVRISGIIKCAKESSTALMFLIDEIFRGTNSDDRTEGALIVLKNLSAKRICGMMTTHDYAMIDRTVDTYKNICYYHFSEKYSDTGITFDYKLADGISRESNARFLMNLVGIE